VLWAAPWAAAAQDAPARQAASVTSANDPVIFAAASLKNVLDAIAASWKNETGKSVTISYAASSVLARQIEQGAPADIFISADLDWMDWLQQRHLIKANTRRVLLGNSLVLIASAESKMSFMITLGADLAGALGDGRLSLGETRSVPAGKYAKEALEKLGMWEGVESKLAQSDNVRAALALVARGEAPLGIVYATDAKAEPKVRVIDTFPASMHAPIVYPAAIVASSKHPAAREFLDFLRSADAAAIFVKHGFRHVE
jgi:molybdate transport system substrate-binding protein